MTTILTTGIIRRIKKITTQSGDPMTVASLETGHDGSHRFFFNVKTFGAEARKLAEVEEGSIVTIQGALSESKYEKDGQTRWSKDIKVTGLLAALVPQKPATGDR